MTDVHERPGRDARVSLREVTKETLRSVLALRVAPEQERLVASNAVSIAQAHFEPEVSWFRAVYADETPVGFVMLREEPRSAEFHLWRFMIDHRFQGMGFGSQAIQLLVEHVRTRPDAVEITTSCVPGEGSPGPFYEKCGFTYTGEQDEGEVVMRRSLTT